MNPAKPAAVRPVRRPKSKSNGNLPRKRPEPQPHPGDPNEEVSALIEALHDNVQRLEDLTAGEVDAIADRHGRTFLLRRAQESLRASEAAKQAAILNALPAHIALLDPQGFIISVNEAWRRFAGANVLQSPGHGIGLNYLRICDSARGVDSSEAQSVAKGIRAVLGGTVTSYSIEYPCHSPTEQRWFLMTVTPLSEDSPNGVVVMHMDVTAEKQAGTELRRSESLKGAILESSLDCVVTIDHEGKIVEFNPASERTFGFSREQALDKVMVDLIVPPRLRDAHRRGFAHYLATGKGPIVGKRIELEAIRADGTEFPIELAISAIVATTPPMFTGFIRDISDRKRVEISMAELQDRYRQLVDLSPDAIHIHQEGKFVFVNNACLHLFGVTSPEQLLGRPLLDFIAREHRETARERMRVQYEKKSVMPGIEQKVLRLDGSVVDVEIKSAPFTFEGRHAVQTVVRDITDRKRTEEALRQFRAAMDISPDLILLIDRASMRFVDVNDTTCRELGYSRDELLATGPDDVTLISREELAGLYDRLIAGDSSVTTVEMHYRRKDGSLFPVELFRRAVPSRDGHTIVIIARDITERRRAVVALQTSEREQRQLADNLAIERSRLVAAQRVAKIGSWETDIATQSVIWSDETHRIHETDPATFRPTHPGFLEFVHPEDRARVDEAFGQSLGQRATYKKIEHRLLLPDGRIKFVEERWRVYFDKQKKPVRAVGTCQDITERKKIEGEIQETRNFLASIFDNIPNSIFVKDARDLKFVRANAASETLTGYSEKEILGKSDFDFFPKDQAAFFVAKDRETLAGNPQVSGAEETITSKNGTKKFLLTKKFAILGSDGRPQYLLGMSEDITERKKIEAEIHESKTFLASIFDNIPNSIFVKDARDLRFVRVNAASRALMGYSEKELLGKNDYDFFPKEQADFFVAKDREALAGTKQVVIVEETMTSKDGTQKLLLTKKFSILDKDGHPQYLLGMSEDITERKHAERRLQESEAKFRHLIEQADDGMFTSDAQGNFVLVNSRGCELLGYTQEEMIGMNGSVTYPEEDRELHGRRLQAVEAGQTLRFERLVKRKDGNTFPAEISIKKLDNGMVQVIFHDITQRRSQEKKISRLSRIQAVLSGTNAAIIRIRDRRELFQETCRLIVQHGHFTLGWIALLDPATGKLTAVAQAGLPDNAGVDSHLFDGSVALVPGGTAEVALRTKHSAVDNAIENAPGSVPEHEPDTLKVRRAAIKLGAKSVIVLPLVVETVTFGILTLYAPEQNFFDDEEVKLLNDLAGDISFGLEFIAKNEKVNYLAYYDVLTGLANRSLFLERVSQYMRIAASAGHKLALYLIDLERFKNINDSLGQSAGDTLLRQVAEWLTRNAGDVILVARVGADHFAVVLPEVKQKSDVARLIATTMDTFLDHPFHLIDSIFRVAAKAGVALFPDDGPDADTLYRRAEAALKKAKASGDRYLFYTQQMTEMVAVKLTLENQLRQALDNEEFVLHYQPKVNLESGKLTSAEALIRWKDPRSGLVPPARFIPILEETGLINEVGRWALRKAIEDYLRWRTMGLAAVRIAVNVSPLQLRNRGFIAEIEHAIGIDVQAAAGLELEITESLVMEDVKHSIASLQAIRAMGVRIAIDDFGTGFSSLSYLAKLPVDTLKIDRSFVIDMTAAQEGLALVSTIISLAHSLKLNVVAEGVETEEQSRLLRLLACDEMQGYLFSKPVPCEIFETKFLAPRTSE